MDNKAIAQIFTDIANLLEIRGDNAFKIRAYQSAAETIATWGEAVAGLDSVQLRELPGIGKDLAAKIREIVDTGGSAYHQELLQQFPRTILDLLKLQGVGPKTVGLLYAALNIRTLEELSAAAREGRLRKLKGMGAKKEALILKAIEERERTVGRHLLAETDDAADRLIDYLRARTPDVAFLAVGSVRRGCETCGDVDVLAIGASPVVMDALIAYPGVERVLGRGETKSSVRLSGGYQADLRLVAPDSGGAAMQYFTGSKAHNIALRDRALQRGLKLNEYGLFRVEDDVRVAGETEEGIYQALGLPYIEPELREARGEVEAALAGQLPRLVERSDIRGDLHAHTTATDGRDPLEAMAAAAHGLGHQYLAITDHSKALAMANGLDERGALEHAARVRALNGHFEGLTLLAGIECDILADGRLDLADDCLAQLDLVVASIHSHFSQDETQTTERLLRAIECPWVDILGHPTARLLLKREPLRVDIDRVIGAAAAHGVALEINCQVDRLDLNDAHARAARDRGARLVISTDAHSTGALANMRWGVAVARRAWLEAAHVLNTRSIEALLPELRRNRERPVG